MGETKGHGRGSDGYINERKDTPKSERRPSMEDEFLAKPMPRNAEVSGREYVHSVLYTSLVYFTSQVHQIS